MSSGPSYTYFNSEQCTTLDHCLLDSHATHMLYHAGSASPNQSDHLPVSANLHLISLSQPTINWKKATLDGSIMTYQQCVSTHLPTHQCDSSLVERSRLRNSIWCYSHPEHRRRGLWVAIICRRHACRGGYRSCVCLAPCFRHLCWRPHNTPSLILKLKAKRDT